MTSSRTSEAERDALRDLIAAEWDCDPAGFEWIDCGDSESSVVSLIRKGKTTSAMILVICNFTPVPRYNYRFGVPQEGEYVEVLNTDSTAWAGSGVSNGSPIRTEPLSWHGHGQSIAVTLPPLAVVAFRRQG